MPGRDPSDTPGTPAKAEITAELFSTLVRRSRAYTAPLSFLSLSTNRTWLRMRLPIEIAPEFGALVKRWLAVAHQPIAKLVPHAKQSTHHRKMVKVDQLERKGSPLHPL